MRVISGSICSRRGQRLGSGRTAEGAWCSFSHTCHCSHACTAHLACVGACLRSFPSINLRDTHTHNVVKPIKNTPDRARALYALAAPAHAAIRSQRALWAITGKSTPGCPNARECIILNRSLTRLRMPLQNATRRLDLRSPPSSAALVKPATNAKFGEYQSPVAMALFKQNNDVS